MPRASLPTAVNLHDDNNIGAVPPTYMRRAFPFPPAPDVALEIQKTAPKICSVRVYIYTG